MCDIYVATCSHAKCARVLEVHLADFAMQREDVVIFCGKHLPARNVVIHRALEKEFMLRVGGTWGFRFRAPLPAGYNFGDFCPDWGIKAQIKVLGNPVMHKEGKA